MRKLPQQNKGNESDAAHEIARLNQALIRAEQALGPLNLATITARTRLANTLNGLKRPELAWPLLEQAVHDMERAYGPLDPGTIELSRNLAVVYFKGQRIADARRVYEHTAAQSATVRGPRDPCTLQARHGAARCLLETHRFDEAIGEFERLLPDSEAGYGPAHRDFLWDRYWLAAARDASGRAHEAMDQYRKLLADCEQALDPGDSLTRRLSASLEPPPRPWLGTEPVTSRRLWLLGLSAIISARQHCSAFDTLYPSIHLDRGRAETGLQGSWRITSGDELRDRGDWIIATGHRATLSPALGHPPVAWDVARYAHTIRNGFAAEYVSEAEAWRLLESLAGLAATAYGSWREFADDYLAARQLAYQDRDGPGGYAVSQQQTVSAVEWLLDPASARSPWNLVPWSAGAGSAGAGSASAGSASAGSASAGSASAGGWHGGPGGS